MITSSNTMALNNHYATALGPRLGLGLGLDFGSQVWFVQYFSENLVVVLYVTSVKGVQFEKEGSSVRRSSVVGRFLVCQIFSLIVCQISAS